MYGGADRDVFMSGREDGIGDVIDGGEGGDDFDTLDLRGAGPLRVTFEATTSRTAWSPFRRRPATSPAPATFVNIENVIPCFTPGTLIATPRRARCRSNPEGRATRSSPATTASRKSAGPARKTLDDFAGGQPASAAGADPQGSLGNGLPERDMMVSPNHRMLVANDRTALYFDEHEVLVAAKHLIGARG
jgi:hypothetical protein